MSDLSRERESREAKVALLWFTFCRKHKLMCVLGAFIDAVYSVRCRRGRHESEQSDKYEVIGNLARNCKGSGGQYWTAE